MLWSGKTLSDFAVADEKSDPNWPFLSIKYIDISTLRNHNDVEELPQRLCWRNQCSDKCSQCV